MLQNFIPPSSVGFIPQHYVCCEAFRQPLMHCHGMLVVVRRNCSFVDLHGLAVAAVLLGRSECLTQLVKSSLLQNATQLL
jgi:hypothetical protein